MSTAVTEPNNPAQPGKNSDNPEGLLGRFSKLIKGGYFQESSWVLVCTILGGVFFWAVHFCARKMPPAEYGIVTTLLQVLNQMAIPAMGLQTIFVQEAALSETAEHRKQLAGAFWAVSKAIFIFWIAVLLLVLAFQGTIMDNYKIVNPVALWATAVLPLTTLLKTMFDGLLLGRQNFRWYGISNVATAFSRLAFVAVIVFALSGYAAGTMIAVVLSMVTSIGIGVWQTYPLWFGVERARFVWTPWIKRIVPLTLGTGATIFMYTTDMIAVQRFLPDSGIYGAAGMISRAIMFLVAPLVMVMFPKIVRSAAKAESSDVLAKAIGATVLVAAGAALFATFFAKIPILIVQGPGYIAAAKLVPLFTWCILPMTVANVLVNNLLARQQYKVVPWLVAVAVGYVITLWQPIGHVSFWHVIYTLGIFSTLYFLVCVWFTWRAKGQ
jgi:O-antigen/teichoic acid export membrane protein